MFVWVLFDLILVLYWGVLFWTHLILFARVCHLMLFPGVSVFWVFCGLCCFRV